MKLRVIGWCDFEDEIPEGDHSFAAVNAIKDDIKAHGYCFSGYAHQYSSIGAPVLNDGKKRIWFSQRGFGGVMAEAQDDRDPWGYTYYAFGLDEEKLPESTRQIDPSEVVAEEELAEEITLEVSPEAFDRAESEGVYIGYDTEALRYIAVGDTLTLVSGDRRLSMPVLSLERGWHAGEEGAPEPEPIYSDELLPGIHCGEEEQRARAEWIYEHAPLTVRISRQVPRSI